MPATFLRKPVPFTEAADFIRNKPVVSREAFFKMLPEVRGRAFLISGLPAFDVAEDIRNAIAKIPEGAIWGDVRKKIASDLVPYFVDPDADAEQQANQQQAADRRAELLIRTHGFQAYQAANFDAMDRNKDVLPYWQYLTMDDSRVRDSHAALNGIVLPADSPFWKTHYPPWDWNCRCQVVPLSNDDVADLRAMDERREPENRRILGPEAQRVLETEERLIRGGRAWDVTSPANKPPDKGGFRFDPSGLRISLDALKARYSPEIWREFESWAGKTDLGDGRTMLEWMMGRPQTIDNRPQTRGRPVTVDAEEPARQPEKEILHSEVTRRLKDVGFDRVEIASSDIVPVRAVEMLERDARLVAARGIQIPPRLTISEPWFNGMYRKLEWKHPAAYDEKTDVVMINGHRYAAATPLDFHRLYNDGAISTSADNYLLLHETGHRMHHQNAPDLYNALLTKRERQLAMNFVSGKAATDAAEFVAETFCGLKTKSKDFPPEVHETFDRLGGAL